VNTFYFVNLPLQVTSPSFRLTRSTLPPTLRVLPRLRLSLSYAQLRFAYPSTLTELSSQEGEDLSATSNSFRLLHHRRRRRSLSNAHVTEQRSPTTVRSAYVLQYLLRSAYCTFYALRLAYWYQGTYPLPVATYASRTSTLSTDDALQAVESRGRRLVSGK
jgi:hypothetical protein